MASPPWFGESLPSDLSSQKAKTLPWFQHGNMLRVFSHVKPRSELLVKLVKVSQKSLKSLSKVSQKPLKSLSKVAQKSLKSLSKVAQKSLKSRSKASQKIVSWPRQTDRQCQLLSCPGQLKSYSYHPSSLMNPSLYILQILFLRFERNTLSPILVQCQAPGRC